MVGFLDACERGDLETIIHIFNDTPMSHMTILDAIKISARYGYFKLVYWLVTKGSIKSHFDAFELACAYDHLAIARYLNSLDFRMEWPVALYYRPMQYAVCRGHLDVVKYLRGKGVGINNNRWFCLAAKYGHLPILKYFCEQGVTVGTNSGSVLIAASKAGHLSVVKWIVSQKVNVHILNDSALFQALVNNHINVCEYLISCGANIGVFTSQQMNRIKYKTAITFLIKHRLRTGVREKTVKKMKATRSGCIRQV